jgi:hypothetical protein
MVLPAKKYQKVELNAWERLHIRYLPLVEMVDALETVRFEVAHW